MDVLNKPHWDDLETVLTLVQCGSLAAAAQVLGVNYTTVARRISRVESVLGQMLFERLSDGYRPTEAGLLVAEHAGEMRQCEDVLLRRLKGQDTQLTGSLVVTAPQLLVAHVLPSAIENFTRAHPDVDLHVRATNDLLDLSRREADLAVRVSKSPGDALTGVRLTPQDTGFFATQSWIDKIQNAPDQPIDWIVYEAHKALPDIVMSAYPSSRIRYRFDDMIAMAGAAAAGLGLVRMPMFLGRRTEQLIEVPQLTPQPYADIWLVGHKDVWPGAKPAAFRNAVRRVIKADRAIFVA